MSNKITNEFIKILDDDARHVVENSAIICINNNHDLVCTNHLIDSIIDFYQSTHTKSFKEIIKKLNISLTIEEIYTTNVVNYPVFSKTILKCMDLSCVYANNDMKNNKIDINTLAKALIQTHTFKNIDKFKFIEYLSNKDKIEKNNNENLTFLSKYTQNITIKILQNDHPEVIGRSEETQNIIDTLCRFKKNNPLLLGEPGVGKTAIIEGLAQEINANNVPAMLLNSHVVSLNMSSMLAGASIQGEFDKRFKGLIDDINNSSKKIILFIDEIHTLIGAGGSAGTNDAANILKPILARAGLKIIGATTWKEYKKYIEKDGAFTRRFQEIKVEELSRENTKFILDSMVNKLQKHHDVLIKPEAIDLILELSKKYFPNSSYPDKPIDILDSACARVAVKQNEEPLKLKKMIEKVRYKKLNLEKCSAFNTNIENIKFLNEDIEYFSKKIEKLKRVYNTFKTCQKEFKNSSNVREKMKIYNKNKELLEKYNFYLIVDEYVIFEIISNHTKIPAKILKTHVSNHLANINNEIKKNILGQNFAIDKIILSLKSNYTFFKDKNKPKGCFFITGPSGIGKTEFALQLANKINKNNHSYVCLNMNEYQEKHSVSRLIGSPPGYIGYGNGGYLTEAVRKRPFSIVILDEFEKAHTDIHNIFYQILDRGFTYDSDERYISFANTIIIATTNLCSELIKQESKRILEKNDYNKLTETVTKELVNKLPVSLIARFSIVPFLDLSNTVFLELVEKSLSDLKKQGLEKNLEFVWDDKIYNYIVCNAKKSSMNAREINKIITNDIIPLIDSHANKKQIHFNVLDNKIAATYTDRI